MPLFLVSDWLNSAEKWSQGRCIVVRSVWLAEMGSRDLGNPLTPQYLPWYPSTFQPTKAWATDLENHLPLEWVIVAIAYSRVLWISLPELFQFLIPLFWITCNVFPSGFQIKPEWVLPYLLVCGGKNVIYIPWDPPLVLYLLTSWQPALQLVSSPHASAEVGLGSDLSGQSPTQKT